MKYFFMIALMGLGSAAMADETSLNSNNEREFKGGKVEFSCAFRGPRKKGEVCEVRGEVCIERRKDGGGLTEGKDGCGRGESSVSERDREDSRIFIRCSNGFQASERVEGELKHDDLIISSKNHGGHDVLEDRKDDGIRLEIENFTRFENHKTLAATLSLGEDDRRGRDDRDFLRLFGSCRVRVEHRDDHRPM